MAVVEKIRGDEEGGNDFRKKENVKRVLLIDVCWYMEGI